MRETEVTGAGVHDSHLKDRGSKVRQAVGAFLCLTAALAALFWLTVVMSATGRGQGTFRVGPFSGSGLRDALVATPTVMALVASQAVLGFGLMKRRSWVGWFGSV